MITINRLYSYFFLLFLRKILEMSNCHPKNQLNIFSFLCFVNTFFSFIYLNTSGKICGLSSVKKSFPFSLLIFLSLEKDFTRSVFQITDECKLTLALHKLRKSLLLFVQYTSFFFRTKRLFIKKTLKIINLCELKHYIFIN